MSGDADPFELLRKMQRTSSVEQAVLGACTSLLTAAKLRNPPIALAPLLGRLEIDFRLTDKYFEPGPGDASLLQIGNTFKILLHNKTWRHNWRRTRFTIAHEIVHVLLIRLLKERQFVSALSATDDRLQRLEALCQLGASELLMPTQHVVRFFTDNGINSISLAGAYDQFLVSRSALIRSITKFFHGIQVVTWKVYARNQHESREWRVADTFPYRRERRSLWLPRGATLKHVSSDLARIIRSSDDEDCVFKNQDLTLGTQQERVSGKIVHFNPRVIKERRIPTFDALQVADEHYDSTERIMIYTSAENPQTGRITR